MSCSLCGAVLKYRRQQKPPKDCPRMLHCLSGLMRTLRMISESLMMLSALHYSTQWCESKEAQRNWACMVHVDTFMHGWQPEVLQVACLILRPSKLGKRLRCDRT